MRWLIGSTLGTKQNVLEKLLDDGMVTLHLDARLAGVEVPHGHTNDFHLRLNLSYRFALDTFDLNDARILAGLSFNGQKFDCVLPWEAIFAITTHEDPVGYLWPESMPEEFARRLGADTASYDTEVAPSESPESPVLRVISTEQPPEEAAESSDQPATSPDVEQDAGPPATTMPTDVAADGTRRYGHLRVVK